MGGLGTIDALAFRFSREDLAEQLLLFLPVPWLAQSRDAGYASAPILDASQSGGDPDDPRHPCARWSAIAREQKIQL